MTSPATSGADMAQDALKYRGGPYVFGGAPGTVRGRNNGTDCSGLINMIIGRDFGLPIPQNAAGQYNGSTHGPVVLDWAATNLCTTLPAGTAPTAGILCIWPGAGAGGHIGMAVDGSHMLSALDTESGVVLSPIVGYGPAGVQLVYRRYNGVAGAAAAVPGAGLSNSAVLIPVLIGIAVPLVLIAIVIAAAAGAGAAGSAGLVLGAGAATARARRP